MKPATILIVEDDAIVAHIYRTRLEKEGFAVEIAADGQTGLYKLQSKRPDAVLLDLMLPKISGLDLLRKMRSELELAEIPVIVLTNAYMPGMVNEALSAGASKVFNKSLATPQQIIDALHVHIAKNRLPGSYPEIEEGGGISANRSLAQPAPYADDSAKKFLQTFYEQAPSQVSILRSKLGDFNLLGSTEAGVRALQEGFREAHALSAKATLLGLSPLSKLSLAVEAIFQELTSKPSGATPSALRTVQDAVELLPRLCVPGIPNDLLDAPPLAVLAVDDDAISLRTLTTALESSLLEIHSFNQPVLALGLAAKKMFDAIFLDIRMPGIDGFKFCATIRAQGPNRATPVVFVTQFADFMARAQSSLSGGNEVVAKPFLPIEIAVKAITFGVRNRLQSSRDRIGSRDQSGSKSLIGSRDRIR